MDTGVTIITSQEENIRGRGNRWARAAEDGSADTAE